MPKTCSYQLDISSTTAEEDEIGYRCPHLCHRNRRICIFHDPNPDKDIKAFWNALNAYMAKVDADDDTDHYDFRGFVFPAMERENPEKSFYGRKFEKNADFSDTTFSGDADFSDTTFSGDADFSDTTFSGDADFGDTTFSVYTDFSGATFSGDADFGDTTFSDDVYFGDTTFSVYTDFSGATFSGDADFGQATFSGEVHFGQATFSGEVYFGDATFLDCADFKRVIFSDNIWFQRMTFSSDADFGSATFSKNADFYDTTFKYRLTFTNAQFHDEIIFKNAKIGFLKYFDASKANFDGVILESAQFWGIDTLENYRFKDAMLLGLSLAGKKLVNCDFTGAVFAGCHIRAEDFDEATCRNTKYIFTEYEIGDSGAEDFPTPKGLGNIREVEAENPKPKYSPKASSRVPAEGNFGDEGNPVSVAAYFHEPYKWNYALPLPREVRTSFMNYLHFFADYVKATQDLQVQLSQYPEGKKVRLVLQIEDATLRPMVEATLGEYLANLTKPFPEVEVAFRDHEMSDFDKAVFLADYQNTLATTQANLALRYKTLEAEKRAEVAESLCKFYEKHGGEKQYIIDRQLDALNNFIKALPQSNQRDMSQTFNINQTQHNTQTQHNQQTQSNITHTEIFRELQEELSALKHHLKHIRIEDEPDEVPEQVAMLQSDIEEAQKVLANTETPVEEKKGKVRQLLGGFFKAIKNRGEEIIYKGIPYIVTNHKAIGEIYDGIEKNINLLP